MRRRKARRRVLVHARRNAVVEQRDLALGHDEQVAAVQVAVEDAEDHRPFEERNDQRLQHRRGVDARGLHGVDVLVGEAGEPLHHQHPLGHQLGVRARHDDDALPRLGEHASDIEHVLGLEAEVELLDDGLGEQLHQRRRVGQRRDRNASNEMRRDPRHRPDVLAHRLGDPRPLHLDHNVLTRAQRRGVHLRDRGGRQTLAVEGSEHAVERAAQVLFDRLADHVERLRLDLIAQLLEFVDQLVGEQAFAGRQDLPQLDVRRPERLGRLAQATRDAGARDLRRPARVP